jgi:hypothetical protein
MDNLSRIWISCDVVQVSSGGPEVSGAFWLITLVDIWRDPKNVVFLNQRQ